MDRRSVAENGFPSIHLSFLDVVTEIDVGIEFFKISSVGFSMVINVIPLFKFFLQRAYITPV